MWSACLPRSSKQGQVASQSSQSLTGQQLVVGSEPLPGTAPHDLRHTHAAVLTSRGVPRSAVEERLGHEPVDTTVCLYGFLLPSIERGVLAALDDAFGDPLQNSPVPPVVPRDRREGGE